MSLDYRLSEIENWQQLCIRSTDEGRQRLARKTNALVWAGLLVELGTITAKNVDEWDFRLRCIYRIGLGPTEDEDRPDLIDIRQHIGLRTNVSTSTRAQFMKRIKQMVEQAVKDEIWTANHRSENELRLHPD